MITCTEFTLWLTPREPLRSTLRSIIDQLAASLDAVRFEPHLTLHSGPASEAEACAVARMIAEQFTPIVLEAGRLGHTESYTKTLFVQFLPPYDGSLLESARGYSPKSSYVANPHLSLLYKKLPEAKRRELSQSLNFPAGDYVFDRVRLVETETPIEDDGPVRRWRTVFDAPLLEA